MPVNCDTLAGALPLSGESPSTMRPEGPDQRGRPMVRGNPVHPVWLIILAPLALIAFPLNVGIPVAVLAVLLLLFKEGDK